MADFENWGCVPEEMRRGGDGVYGDVEVFIAGFESGVEYQKWALWHAKREGFYGGYSVPGCLENGEVALPRPEN